MARWGSQRPLLMVRLEARMWLGHKGKVGLLPLPVLGTTRHWDLTSLPTRGGVGGCLPELTPKGSCAVCHWESYFTFLKLPFPHL